MSTTITSMIYVSLNVTVYKCSTICIDSTYTKKVSIFSMLEEVTFQIAFSRRRQTKTGKSGMRARLVLIMSEVPSPPENQDYGETYPVSCILSDGLSWLYETGAATDTSVLMAGWKLRGSHE